MLEDASGQGEKKDVLNRTRWRVGGGEIAVRVGYCKSSHPQKLTLNRFKGAQYLAF